MFEHLRGMPHTQTTRFDGATVRLGGADVPQPAPDVVPLPPSPHPVPAPPPQPPEIPMPSPDRITDPFLPGQNEPVGEPVVPSTTPLRVLWL